MESITFTIDDLILKYVPFGYPSNHAIKHAIYSLQKFSEIHLFEDELFQENLKQIIDELKDSAFINLFSKAEELSKSKHYEESIFLINKLILAQFQRVDVYIRQCKNYHSIQDFSAEIQLIQWFLTNIQPLYGGNIWKEEFESRLTRAEKSYSLHGDNPHYRSIWRWRVLHYLIDNNILTIGDLNESELANYYALGD